MATYMLATLQVKYGIDNLEQYNEAMSIIRRLFESQGVRLRHGMVTRAGRLYEGWNLWELEDQAHVSRALAALAGNADVLKSNQALAQVVEHEDVRYLESMPFSL